MCGAMWTDTLSDPIRDYNDGYWGRRNSISTASINPGHYTQIFEVFMSGWPNVKRLSEFIGMQIEHQYMDISLEYTHILPPIFLY